VYPFVYHAVTVPGSPFMLVPGSRSDRRHLCFVCSTERLHPDPCVPAERHLGMLAHIDAQNAYKPFVATRVPTFKFGPPAAA
jgi:hypothetical protein